MKIQYSLARAIFLSFTSSYAIEAAAVAAAAAAFSAKYIVYKCDDSFVPPFPF